MIVSMSDTPNRIGNSVFYSDVHTHLQSNLNPYGSQELLIQGRHVGVDRFVCSGTSPNDWEEVAMIARNEPDVYPSFGVHPWYIDALEQSWETTLRQYCDGTRATNGCKPAIGEIGLDFAKQASDKALQERIFILQLDLAIERGLPVIVHCVRAIGSILSLLERLTQVPLVLFHGFRESRSVVCQLAKYDRFYFSFSADDILFPTPRFLSMVQAIRIDRILLESDQPGPLRNTRVTTHDDQTDSQKDGTQFDVPFVPEVVRTPALIPRLAGELAQLRNVETNLFLTTLRNNEDRFFASWPDFSAERMKT